MADGITDEVRRAGWDAFQAAIEGGYDSPQVYAQTLEAIISAFVAGRVVVDLPEPDDNGDYESDYSSVWVTGVNRVASAFGSLRPENAESYAAALLAAAREARRRTAEQEAGVAGGGAQ